VVVARQAPQCLEGYNAEFSGESDHTPSRAALKLAGLSASGSVSQWAKVVARQACTLAGEE